MTFRLSGFRTNSDFCLTQR